MGKPHDFYRYMGLHLQLMLPLKALSQKGSNLGIHLS